MGIGLRIKALRQINNLSQADFAESIGIKRANLAHIESEKQLPTIHILSSIKKKYGVCYTHLIDGDESISPAEAAGQNSQLAVIEEQRRTIKALNRLAAFQEAKLEAYESQKHSGMGIAAEPEEPYSAKK